MANTVTCLTVVVSEFYFCSPWHTCAYVSLCLLSPKVGCLFIWVGFRSSIQTADLGEERGFLKMGIGMALAFEPSSSWLSHDNYFCNNLLLRLVDPDRRMYFLWRVSCLFFVLVAVKRSKSVVLFWLWGIPDQFYHFSASSQLLRPVRYSQSQSTTLLHLPRTP